MKKQRSKRWFERHPKIAFVLFLVITILILDYIAALIFLPYDYNSFRCPDPVFHHGLSPNSKANSIWGNKIYEVTTNSLGFKDRSCRQISFISSKGKKRIVFLGDSFTEGVGMTWEKSFPGMLQAKHPDLEILNAGVVSYSPHLYYLKTKYLIEQKKLQFRELYVFIDNSDPLNELTYEHFTPYDKNKIKKIKFDLQHFLFNHSYLYYAVSNIINSSKRNRVTQSWDRILGNAIVDETESSDEEFLAAMLNWSYTPALYEKWGKKGLELANNYMQQLVELCRVHNIRLKVVIYPWPSVLQHDSANNIQATFWQDFCLENNIDFINLYPTFFNSGKPVETIRKYFVEGDVHWNEKGHQLVAGILDQFIED